MEPTSAAVGSGIAALGYAVKVVNAMRPSEHIKKGDLKLYRTTEMTFKYKDVIAPEFTEDILAARDV